MAVSRSVSKTWCRAFGGVGNLPGVVLRIGEKEFAAPVAAAIGSAYQVVCVRCVGVDETPLPAHSCLGELVAMNHYGAGAMSSACQMSVHLGNDGYEVDVEVDRVDVAFVRVRTYRQQPSWGDERGFHSVVTVLFDLFEQNPADEAGASAGIGIRPRVLGPENGGSWAGDGLLGACDHLGLVFLDLAELGVRLKAHQVQAPDDLIDFLGTHDLADELVADGVVIPVWGMRPWLYRVAAPGYAHHFLPLGRKVGDSFRYRFSAPLARLSVVPGSELHGWRRVRDGPLPSIQFSGAPVTGVEVTIYTATGYEPISPELEVGVLPTVVLRPLADVEAGCDEPVVLDPFDLGSLADPWLDHL